MEMDLHRKSSKRKHTPQKPYWSERLSELWSVMQKAFKNARTDLKGRSRRQILRSRTNNRLVEKYKEAVFEFDKELRSAKKRYSVDKILQIDKLTNNRNPKLFWDEVNKLGPSKKKETVCEALDEDGQVTRDPILVKELWEGEFTKLYCDPPKGNFNDDFYTEKMLELDEINVDANSQNDLNCEISFHEVSKAIKNSKLRKACGCDQIPYESIKNTLCTKALHSLFGICFKTGLIPGDWMKSEIVPISKGKRTIGHEPLTHRGLALQSCIYKLYSAVLNTRLVSHLENMDLISETQNGFRKNRSCTDHVFTLSETIRLNTSTPQSKVYACFVDMRRAFDEIDRNLALLNLHELGVNGNFFRALSAIYKSPVCRIRLNNGETSNWINSHYGTLQGDIISPQIFSCQVNKLINRLNESENGLFYGSRADERFSCLAFADDLVLVAPTAQKLQNLVNILSDLCKNYRMTVNVDKTKTMVFRKNYQTRQPEILIKYDGRILEQVRSYKYLGIYFDEYLKFGKAEEELASAAGRALGSIFNKSREHRDLGLKTFTRLCRGCVDPITDYCSEVLGHESGKKLTDVQLRACRYYLGLPRNTALPVLTAEMGWLPTLDRRRKSVIRYYNRIMKMGGHRLPKKIFLNTVNNDNSWAGKTRKLLESLHLGIYWNTGCAVPTELLDFYISNGYKDRWHEEINSKPKLRLKELEVCWLSCRAGQ